ncbi:MAG: holo-ACP synthase [Lachnospiraceae bacterium]
MILGVGIDRIEIERVKKACEKEAFLLRIYTEEERRQAMGNAAKLAGDFAVKEAVAKTLGTGFTTFLPGDIEVLRDEKGKPYVTLYRGAKKQAESLGMTRIHVSITNTSAYAQAFAVGEGEGS